MRFDPASILKRALPELGCPGALLAFSTEGQIETFSAGSISAGDHFRPFYIYSISKTFTAVAIMQLCEDQENFLDVPLISLLPAADIPNGITVRQVLNHSGGLSDYFSSQDYQRAVSAHPEIPWSYEKLMRVGLKNTPLFPPGKGWAYSNPGYGLLKQLIEKRSGRKYYDFIQACILDRLEMKHTRGFLEPDKNRELLEGDDPTMEGDFRQRYHPGWIATGCLISTVSDVARFYDGLFSGELMSDVSLAQMKETVDVLNPSPSENSPGYGLGLMHFRKSPVGDGYGHGGGGPGYTTYGVHYPELNKKPVSIILVLNKSLPQTPFDLVDELVHEYSVS